MTTTDLLNTILAKLSTIEKLLTAGEKSPAKQAGDAVLAERLTRLTIKRHAVLTATLGEVSYTEIAKLMKCDVTTVKLHLKAALTSLDIPSRSALLATHKRMLDSIPEREYVKRYNISKRWWLENNPSLMDVLTTTKPTANQHIKE
jgi:hypothetical protein